MSLADLEKAAYAPQSGHHSRISSVSATSTDSDSEAVYMQLVLRADFHVRVARGRAELDEDSGGQNKYAVFTHFSLPRMRFHARLLPVFLLLPTTLVCAQGDDTIGSVTTDNEVFDSFLRFSYLTAPVLLNNITFELVTGAADATGGNVLDIMIANISSASQTRFDYTFHPGIPSGIYHARMNGTIFNGDTQLGSTSALSNSFSFSGSSKVCGAGTFTPITGLAGVDPNYRPVRFSQPIGGDVIVQSALIGPSAGLILEVDRIDALSPFLPGPMTKEVINTETGFNAGVQTGNLILLEPLEYITSNLTLDPGPWKIRLAS
ncbi:hypothetical protein MKEN_00561100 [Mycena kentingensis (nom. inval.)]|nr:hypothetical protein MKEN_00561100 [Mycena kentingensis (nom. inval.)]